MRSKTNLKNTFPPSWALPPPWQKCRNMGSGGYSQFIACCFCHSSVTAVLPLFQDSIPATGDNSQLTSPEAVFPTGYSSSLTVPLWVPFLWHPVLQDQPTQHWGPNSVTSPARTSVSAWLPPFISAQDPARNLLQHGFPKGSQPFFRYTSVLAWVSTIDLHRLHGDSFTHRSPHNRLHGNLSSRTCSTSSASFFTDLAVSGVASLTYSHFCLLSACLNLHNDFFLLKYLITELLLPSLAQPWLSADLSCKWLPLAPLDVGEASGNFLEKAVCTSTPLPKCKPNTRKTPNPKTQLPAVCIRH